MAVKMKMQVMDPPQLESSEPLRKTSPSVKMMKKSKRLRTHLGCILLVMLGVLAGTLSVACLGVLAAPFAHFAAACLVH